MKLKNKKIIWNKKVITIVLCALFLVIIGGISYAYFAASVTGNDTAKEVHAYAGTMSLEYDGTFELSVEDLLPGDSYETKFSVTNTGSLATSYEVNLSNVINTFEKQGEEPELVYSITSTNNGGQLEISEVPLTSQTIIPAVGIAPGVTQEYSLKIHFKEMGVDQNYNQGKIFTGLIQINGLEDTNYLAGNVLRSQIKLDDINYLNATPTRVFKKKVTKDYNIFFNMNKGYSQQVAQGTSITFNSENSYYTINDFSNEYISDESVGKYYCLNTGGVPYDCSAVVKIKEIGYKSDSSKAIVNNVGTLAFTTSELANALYSDSYTIQGFNFILNNPKKIENVDDSLVGQYFLTNGDSAAYAFYVDSIIDDAVNVTLFEIVYPYEEVKLENQSVEYNSSDNIMVSSSYVFDETNGKYILDNALSNVSYSEDYIGYYTCNSNSSSCQTMYKITKVEGTNVTEATIYKARNYGYSYITNADIYSSGPVTEENNSGMYITKDDKGPSYYYRGQVNNNYVSFANKLWRITRINGDGTIRLILNTSSGNTYFNNTTNTDEKYLGYTYDNGINSTLKNYLENWYNSNLSSYDDKIVSGIYCNDTTSRILEDGTVEYGAKIRIDAGEPSLICEETDKTYGGKYDLKIGLLSADEYAYAGINSNEMASTNNYLYFYGNDLTMSPYVNDGTLNIYSRQYSKISNTKINTSIGVRPVINLRKDITIQGGDGTQSNPYIIG